MYLFPLCRSPLIISVSASLCPWAPHWRMPTRTQTSIAKAFDTRVPCCDGRGRGRRRGRRRLSSIMTAWWQLLRLCCGSCGLPPVPPPPPDPRSGVAQGQSGALALRVMGRRSAGESRAAVSTRALTRSITPSDRGSCYIRRIDNSSNGLSFFILFSSLCLCYEVYYFMQPSPAKFAFCHCSKNETKILESGA